MSDPINANPTVIDVSSLPKRVPESDGLNKNGKSFQLIERITSLSLLRKQPLVESSDENIPDLMKDVHMGESLDDELFEYLDKETEERELYENLEEFEDEIDAQEIFDLISTISDPEHPLTLAQLAVVNLSDIQITHGQSRTSDISEVLIRITPTITHCSLATLIGLGIRVRLERSLPARFRIKIIIKEGTHQSENQVNKQLNDKERVAAACENDQLLSVILQMLSTCK